jgi:hypothetical protein
MVAVIEAEANDFGGPNDRLQEGEGGFLYGLARSRFGTGFCQCSGGDMTIQIGCRRWLWYLRSWLQGRFFRLW